MKNFILLIFTIFFLIGCGNSEKTTSTNNQEPDKNPVENVVDTKVDVIVERGALLNATVTDSSSPMQTATQVDNSNVYRFDKTPTYPIKAVGGIIDVDNNGIDEGDLQFNGELSSYSDVITVATTYVGDFSTSQGKERLELLKTTSNMQNDDEILKKVPSQVSKDAIALANALYKNYYEYFLKESSEEIDLLDANKKESLSKSFQEYKTYVENSQEDLKTISINVEEKLIKDMQIEQIKSYEVSSVINPDETKVLTLNSQNLTIEDNLATAILKVQEALALINITENQFYMSTDSNSRLRLYNFIKSYEQAISYLNDLIRLHEQLDTLVPKTTKSLTSKAYSCNPSVDPYCITNAQHRKIDFYIDHYGETTPAGNKIDLKLIAQRTKQDIELIYDSLQRKYGRIYALETALAQKHEAAQTVATALSNAGDVSSALLGIKGGVTVLKEGIKYGLKKKAQTTLFKTQLQKPAQMTQEVYDVLRNKYFTKWTQDTKEILLKSREDILLGSWDIASNFVSLYNKSTDFGIFEKSETLSNVGKVMDISNLGLNVAKIGNTIAGATKLLILKNPVTNKKQIVFISDSLAQEIVYENNGDLIGLSKASIGFIYDKNGNLQTWIENIFKEEIDFIKEKKSQQQLEDTLEEGNYEYTEYEETDDETNSDEEGQTKQLTSTANIEFEYIENQYHKNKEDRSISEFLNVDSDYDGIIDFNDKCPNNYGKGTFGEPICTVSEVLSDCSCVSNLEPLSNDYYISECKNDPEYIYHDNGKIKYEYCRYDLTGSDPKILSFPTYSNNLLGTYKEYYETGELYHVQNLALVLDEKGNKENVLNGETKTFTQDEVEYNNASYTPVKNDDNSWSSIQKEGNFETKTLTSDKSTNFISVKGSYVHKKAEDGNYYAVLDGTFSNYWETGEVKQTGTYNKGLKIGKWTAYWGPPWWPFEAGKFEYNSEGKLIKSELCYVYLLDSEDKVIRRAYYSDELGSLKHELICTEQ